MENSLNYIHGLYRKGTKPGLERIGLLLEKLGDPHKKLKFVHVAGTNGKGSTCAMLASILNASGYKVGLYTSPFLQHFQEQRRLKFCLMIHELHIQQLVHRLIQPIFLMHHYH